MFGTDPELGVALFVKMCPKYWAACGGLIQFGCALKHLQTLVGRYKCTNQCVWD